VPRYFFHVHDSSDFLDSEGVELPDLVDAARTQAVIAAGEALKDLDGKFWKSPDWRMWVTDEAGETVCTLTFSAQ
jgi:hypothetical protein